MKKIVLLGGNGYIGRNLTKKWLEKDKDAEFYIVSRSGENKLKNGRIYNIKADVTDYQDVISKLPSKIDYILDLIGKPESNTEELKKFNYLPAEVMLKIAKEKDVKIMGFIGGILGPKSFIQAKKEIADNLISSGIRTEIVNPSIVYGNGRNDVIMKLIPLLKFFGLFSKKMKPVHIDNVVNEMLAKLLK